MQEKLLKTKTISFLSFCCTFFIFLSAKDLKAQQKDSLRIQTDSLSTELVEVTQHSPRKATLMSAIIPGLGQVYNKKYWKVPIIYAGIGGLYYVFNYNQELYRSYKIAYILRMDKSPDTVDEYEGIYSAENLLTYQELYRRNRDLSIIGMAAFYVLNIIDANVDAHLFSFDVSEDLSLQWQPSIHLNKTNTLIPILSLTLKL